MIANFWEEFRYLANLGLDTSQSETHTFCTHTPCAQLADGLTRRYTLVMRWCGIWRTAFAGSDSFQPGRTTYNSLVDWWWCWLFSGLFLNYWWCDAMNGMLVISSLSLWNLTTCMRWVTTCGVAQCLLLFPSFLEFGWFWMTQKNCSCQFNERGRPTQIHDNFKYATWLAWLLVLGLGPYPLCFF